MMIMTELLRREPHVISAGLSLLADAAAQQGARVTRVDWAPPLPGTETDLTTVLADPRRAAANALAGERPGGGAPARFPRLPRRCGACRYRARPWSRRVPARRAADRLGPGIGPVARRADRSRPVRGA